MELIRCPRCAKEIPDLSRFCRRCGCSVGWGLAGGISPAWSGLADVGVFAERPVTLAGAGRSTPSSLSNSSAASPASWSRHKPISKKRGGGGVGAWVASLVLGFAAFAFVTHVHRAATRPLIMPRPAHHFNHAVPERSDLLPRSPRSYPRPLPSDAVNRRFAPALPEAPPPPPPSHLRSYGGESVYVRTPARPSSEWPRAGSGPRRASSSTDEESDATDPWPRAGRR